MSQGTAVKFNSISGAITKIDQLNHETRPLSYENRLRYLFETFDEREILVTSSMGVKSMLLLTLLAKVKKDHPVYFVDTGYHFKETLKYKNLISNELGLNIISIYPEKDQHKLTREEKWWEEHPRMCCTINKIAPLQPIISQHSVWASNLMAFETDFRARLDIFQLQGSIIKFHPFVDVNEEEFKVRLRQLKVPLHPLFNVGFDSIGCSHCTSRGGGRSGRWQGKAKTECGLHLKYFTKDHTGNEKKSE